MRSPVYVRTTQLEDHPQIAELTTAVYPFTDPWFENQIASHINIFPGGQFVAIDRRDNDIVGMAASLVIRWEDYEPDSPWRIFTANGTFSNHDPHGETLYGAEVMVHPERQRMGIGKKIYQARRELVKGLGLLRIRAGARPRGYHRYANEMSIGEYARQISAGTIKDPTLTFQIREGFHIVEAIPDYLPGDTESLGYSVTIEWLNPEVATEENYAAQENALATMQ